MSRWHKRRPVFKVKRWRSVSIQQSKGKGGAGAGVGFAFSFWALRVLSFCQSRGAHIGGGVDKGELTEKERDKKAR